MNGDDVAVFIEDHAEDICRAYYEQMDLDDVPQAFIDEWVQANLYEKEPMEVDR